MKIALVHDWLDSMSGAERVLLELHRMYPDAPIYTLFAEKEFTRAYFPDADIRTSWIQRIPGHRTLYRKLLAPLMAIAVESFDLADYDVIISSSPFFAKGIVVRPHTKHISYCYSPARQLWDRNGAYQPGITSSLAKHVLRLWDRSASDRVDEFVAISKHVRERIKKYYKRDARVIYPPVATLPQAPLAVPFHNYYLIVSRLYSHKNIHIAIEAFNRLGYTLVIIGSGPEWRKLRQMADRNIHFFEDASDEALAAYYQNCTAFIMPQEEDFGITPVEAMQYGKPVLALRKGGALETMREGISGEFFDDPIPEALADGVRRLKEKIGSFDPATIKASVTSFAPERFRNEIASLVTEITT